MYYVYAIIWFLAIFKFDLTWQTCGIYLFEIMDKAY